MHTNKKKIKKVIIITILLFIIVLLVAGALVYLALNNKSNNVKEVKTNAFANCENLVTVVLPSNITLESGEIEQLNTSFNENKNDILAVGLTEEEYINIAKQQADQIVNDAQADAKHTLSEIEQKITLNVLFVLVSSSANTFSVPFSKYFTV